MDGECVADVTCAEGTTLVDGECVADVTCAEGTTLVDGECVADVTCAVGTTLADGECVADVTCAVGTTLVDGECVPDATCAEGTTLVEGKCVADVTCGPGTTATAEGCVPNCRPGTLADENGDCVIDPASCAAGTTYNEAAKTCEPDVVCTPEQIAYQGHCLSQTEIDASMADVVESAEENNDTDFGGTPEAVTLAAIGDAAIFTGAIGEPTDLDGDGEADQDFDQYAFTGTAGTMVKVAIRSLGPISMGFSVTGPNDYVRMSSLDFDPEPSRYVVLPYDGTYVIGVGPQNRVTGWSTPPHGGADYGYVGAIEQVAFPTATPLTAAAAGTGTFVDLRDNLFQVDGPIGEWGGVGFADEAGSGTYPVLLTFDANGNFLAELTRSSSGAFLRYAHEDDLLVLVDYSSIDAPTDTFALNVWDKGAVELGALGADSKTASAGHDLSTANGQFTLTVAPDQVVAIELDPTSPSLQVLDASGAVAAYDSRGSARFYSAGGGDYLVVVNEYASKPVDIEIVSSTPTDLGALNSTSAPAMATVPTLEANGTTYFVVKAEEALAFAFDARESNARSLRFDAYTTDFENLETAYGSRRLWLPHVEGIAGESIFLVVENRSGLEASDVMVTAVASRLGPEAEPNDTLGEATPFAGEGVTGAGKLTSKNDKDYFVFTPPTTGLYKFSSEADSGTAVMDLLNASGEFIAVDGSGADEVAAVLQGGVVYYLLHHADVTWEVAYYFTVQRFELDGLESEPNDSAATAGVAGMGVPVAGTLTGSADVDWFKVSLVEAQVVDAQFGSLDADGLSVPTNSRLTWYLQDGTTEIVPTGTFYDVPAGDTLVRVDGYDSAGSGNSYRLSMGLPPVTVTSTPGLAFGDDPKSVVDILNFPTVCDVASVTVDVDITHSYRGDIGLHLESPSGTIVRLLTGAGGSAQDLIGNYPKDMTPYESLDLLIGEAATGDWSLTAMDQAAGDDGVLNSWSLNVSCSGG